MHMLLHAPGARLHAVIGVLDALVRVSVCPAWMSQQRQLHRRQWDVRDLSWLSSWAH